jgi:hypothetical protein
MEGRIPLLRDIRNIIHNKLRLMAAPPQKKWIFALV